MRPNTLTRLALTMTPQEIAAELAWWASEPASETKFDRQDELLRQQVATGDLCLIWSNEHRAWWGPGGNGYVEKMSYAGRYTWAHALAICLRAVHGSRRTLNELPVRLNDAVDLEAGFFARYPQVPPEDTPFR